jgi:hypothetical protein
MFGWHKSKAIPPPPAYVVRRIHDQAWADVRAQGGPGDLAIVWVHERGQALEMSRVVAHAVCGLMCGVNDTTDIIIEEAE